MDQGANPSLDGGPLDTLDLTPIGKSFTFYNDQVLGYQTKYINFQDIKLDPGNDTVIFKGPDASSWKQVDFGDGNDTVDSDVKNLKINFGNGDDTVLHAGQGSVINLGMGHDTVVVSNDILVAGASANTVIENAAGYALHGALGNVNSESVWVTGADGTRYSLDTDGELVIKDAIGDETFIANYQGGPNVPLADQTAGILVGTEEVDAERLLQLKHPYGTQDIKATFQLGNDITFTQTGKHFFAADPLVLDLSGNGLALTGESTASPVFDMFGTGFGVHTGWVQPSAGILVIANSDGTVTSVDQFVGGENSSGFAALAQLDSNGDGMIDANDPIYAQLSIWQDTNGNGVVDPGEFSAAQAGIASINVASDAVPANTTIAGNTITATGTFTCLNGTASTISDVSFMTDTFHSTYLGNTTVSAAAAAMPNLKGYGTLTDLRVAMTLDPALINSVNVNLSTLNQINMAALRTAAMPILDAWARAVELPDAGGNLHTVDPAAHPDVPILVGTDQDGNPAVNDFAYQATDPSTGLSPTGSSRAARP